MNLFITIIVSIISYIIFKKINLIKAFGEITSIMLKLFKIFLDKNLNEEEKFSSIILNFKNLSKKYLLIFYKIILILIPFIILIFFDKFIIKVDYLEIFKKFSFYLILTIIIIFYEIYERKKL